jgi:hypothetical protein
MQNFLLEFEEVRTYQVIIQAESVRAARDTAERMSKELMLVGDKEFRFIDYGTVPDCLLQFYDIPYFKD